MAEKTPIASRTFESFLNKVDTTMPADPVTINELKKLFYLEEQTKIMTISSNVIKHYFIELN